MIQSVPNKLCDQAGFRLKCFLKAAAGDLYFYDDLLESCGNRVTADRHRKNMLVAIHPCTGVMKRKLCTRNRDIIMENSTTCFHGRG